jgi:hypothetical protein
MAIYGLFISDLIMTKTKITFTSFNKVEIRLANGWILHQLAWGINGENELKLNSCQKSLGM